MLLRWSIQCHVYVILCNKMFPNSHENYQEMEYETEIVDLEKATTQMGDGSTGTVVPKSLHWDTLRYTFQTRSCWTARKILSGWDRNSVGNCGHRFCSRFLQSISLGFMLRLLHGCLWDSKGPWDFPSQVEIARTHCWTHFGHCLARIPSEPL